MQTWKTGVKADDDDNDDDNDVIHGLLERYFNPLRANPTK